MACHLEAHLEKEYDQFAPPSANSRMIMAYLWSIFKILGHFSRSTINSSPCGVSSSQSKGDMGVNLSQHWLDL